MSKSNQLHSTEENIMYQLLLTRGWALVGFCSAHNLLSSNVYELRRQKEYQDLQYPFRLEVLNT